MTIPQSTVSSMQPGFPGLVADTDLGKKTVTRVSEEATAEIPFGVFVAEGTATDQAALLAANTDVLAGVVVHSHAYAKPDELGDTGLKPKVTLGCLTRGTIWVLVESTLPVKGDEVHVRAVAAGSEVAGAVRVAKDGTDTIDATAFCSWTGRTGTACAELEVNLVNRALAVADS